MFAFSLDSQLNSVGAVGEMIVASVERYSARTAFSCSARSFTYKQLGHHIRQTLQFFKDEGLKPGDVVMQISANRYEMFVLMAACYIGGYISVTPHYGNSLEDHIYVMNDACATLVVLDSERSVHAAQLLRKCNKSVGLYSHDVDTGLTSIWPLIKMRNGLPLDESSALPSDPIRLIYTGGTTGKPKGVITLSSQLAFASLLHIAEQGFSTNTKMLCTSPISHGAGSFIIPVLFRGGEVVLRNGFVPERILHSINRNEINSIFCVPTMLYKLMDSPLINEIDLSSLKKIIYAGAPISPSRVQQALALFGNVITQNYGQSEVPGTVLALTPEDHSDPAADKVQSIGKPYPCVTVRLLDEDDQLVSRGKGIGEICVRAPHATPGYWNKPDLSRDLWKGGWLHTGDMAYQDGDGYFYLVDRKKDMIISGGFNIYPQEIENALMSHPAVSGTAVIGIPHEKWGETVLAFVVLREGMKVSKEVLIAHVKEKKGSVMAPKIIEIIDDLPLTSLGKVDKKALRRPYWEGFARAIN